MQTAFKRSLAAGILDDSNGEISLGGSRLNRLLKDVENVTGKMGEGETMPAPETARRLADGLLMVVDALRAKSS